jgi:hypothetical protein
MKLNVNRETLNRMYWLDEMTLDQIAKVYGVTLQTIWYHMQRFGIPRRKSRQTRQGLCVESDCEKSVCKIRKWTKVGYRWHYTIRCAEHHHALYRLIARRSWRRRNGLKGDGESVSHKARNPLGVTWLIAKE